MATKTRRTRRPSAPYFISVQVAGGKEAGIMMTDEQRNTYVIALRHAIALANSAEGTVARVYENGILMSIASYEG